jgi:filamin
MKNVFFKCARLQVIKFTDAGKGVPEVVILDPSGQKNTVPVKLRQISQDVWRCEYASSGVGVHSVNVFFAGKPIPKSPYGVSVAPICDAKKVRASGRGLQPKGVRVKDVADFKIHTDGAGEGKVEVRIIGPGKFLAKNANSFFLSPENDNLIYFLT